MIKKDILLKKANEIHTLIKEDKFKIAIVACLDLAIELKR